MKADSRIVLLLFIETTGDFLKLSKQLQFNFVVASVDSSSQQANPNSMTDREPHRVVIFRAIPSLCFFSWVALSHRKQFQIGETSRIKSRAKRKETHTQGRKQPFASRSDKREGVTPAAGLEVLSLASAS